jgi:cellulose synthase (UDP-forming)
MPEPEIARGAQAPPRIVKERVFGAWDWAAFVLLSLLGLAAIIACAVTWFSIGWGPHPVIFVVLTGLSAALLVNQQGRWFLLLPMRRPVPMPASPGWRVAVVTTHVPDAESVEMLEATLRAMIAIDYSHDTWLLDEGDSSKIRALCQRLGVRHFSRRDMPQYQAAGGTFRSGSKHGNYNAWLHHIGFGQYDFLVAFDPDHLPIPSYVSQTLGFFRDPKIGYVQAAQAFYNQRASVVARGAAEETYAYYSAVQMASYGLDYPIIVGSHNSHRMAALESIGGLAAHDADDLLLTLKYRSAGWEGVYVPRILARGLAPVDWRGYLAQQRRWARSVLDLKLRHRAAYASTLPLTSRIMSFLHGFNFLHRSVAFLGVVCILVYLLATRQTLDVLSPRMVLPTVGLLVALQLQELYRQRFYLDWRAESGLHLRSALLEYAKWPWFLLALLDALIGRQMRYTITRKTPGSGVFLKFVAWNLAIVVLVGGTWAVARIRGGGDPRLGFFAAPFVLASLCLAASGLKQPPPPYTAGLWTPGTQPSQAPEPTDGPSG